MHESLNQYTTTLVGRSRETAEVLTLLLDPDIALVTLIGTSGTGKTRLSLEVIIELEKHNKQQLFFVPVAAITNPKLVLPTLAQHLQIQDHISKPLIEHITDYLTENPSIIILDNFEQVLAAKADIEYLIKAVSHLKILITSQEALNISSETVYTIPGLHTPDTIPSTPEEAQSYAAIQLFTQRIQLVQPNFCIQQDTIAPITEICQLLEGLPLAIEIVATHSDTLLPQDLRLLVRQHLMLYRLKTKKAVGRQRIILPIIEWSLLRLPQSAQALFQHLGAFRGGWTLAALEKIVTEHDYEIASVLNILIDRHLILRQAIQNDTTRYMMLDAVQDYADKQFKQHTVAKRNSIYQRHMIFIQDLAKTIDNILIHGNQEQQADYMTRANHEMPNIRLLLEWALAFEPEQAVPLVIDLGRCWTYGGYVQEGFNWYAQVEATAQLTADQYAALRMQQSLALLVMGQLTMAIERGKQGITYAQQTENHRIQSIIYNTLALIMLDTQELKQAQTYLEEGLRHARLCNMKEIIPSFIGNLAVIELNNHNYDKALHLFEEAMLLAQQNKHFRTELYSLLNIGCVYIAKRNPETAITYLDQAIKISKTIQAQEVYAICLHFKAEALLLSSNYLPATPLMLESIDIFKQQGWPIQLYGALEKCAIILEQHGEIIEAGIITGAVNRICQELGIAESEIQAHPGLQDMLENMADSVEFQLGLEQGKELGKEALLVFVIEKLSTLMT